MKIFKYFSAFVILLTVFLGVWLFRLNSEIKLRIESGWFKPPVEIYSRGDQIRLNDKTDIDSIRKLLLTLHMRERSSTQALYANDFSIINADECAKFADTPFTGQTAKCVHIRLLPSSEKDESKTVSYIIGLNDQNVVSLLMTGTPLKNVSLIELTPQLFAQFYDGEPILRKVIQIGDAPLECLQAVTAIEDSQFLEHKGVSVTGLARAAMRNLFSGRYAQGGSTITQQLVKNYFLTPEKTLKRKISELFMAILLEANADKDQILSSYLNVVYMGQRGPFQVIGLSAGSDYYFSKPLEKLNLSECALLAAIINSPGRYNPFTQTENAKKRRDFVLSRMVETQMITPEQSLSAQSAPMPAAPTLRLSDPAPYFIQALFRELKKLNISPENGLKIYSTLDVEAQNLAQIKTLEHVQNLEKNNKNITKIKEQGKNIEASLISVDVQTGEILALVGGRQYVKTQYNRVLDAHRQVGSIMKPFVYLTALESKDAHGEPYTPTTIIDDVAFSYKYEGQSWSPKNYTGEFYGPVPLFYALKNSLNAATAKVGIQVGLSNVVDVAKRAGIESEIQPYPSLTLGAFEIFPWEVATGMLTIARFGEKMPITSIRTVQKLDGQLLYKHEPKTSSEFSPQVVARLVSMMKQTLKTGTGRVATLLGFNLPAAGKTGTTSDTKDTWFAGFTPYVLTITWTGYDDNTPSTLTGASGALPLWTQFMKSYATKYPAEDFKWPDGTEKFYVTPAELKSWVPKANDIELAEPTELIR